MSFAETSLEELRLTRERLRAEHTALVQISGQNAAAPPDPLARRAYLDQLREHRARLRFHRTILRSL